MFCEHEIVQLFSVMSHVITVVQKFNLRLVIQESPSHAVFEAHVFDRIFMFFFPDCRGAC
jgi:hypothetical protein